MGISSVAAPSVAAPSVAAAAAPSVFSALNSPATLQIAGSALSGLYQGKVQQNQVNLNTQNQAYNQAVQSYMLNNGNAIAPVNMNATPITQAQKTAAQLASAQSASQQAKTLTGAS